MERLTENQVVSEVEHKGFSEKPPVFSTGAGNDCSQISHTPGPWGTKPETNYVPAQVWADAQQLAEVYGENRKTRAANARLMAAAPELLEALKDLLNLVYLTEEHTPIYRANGEIFRAEQIVAKAKGEL